MTTTVYFKLSDRDTRIEVIASIADWFYKHGQPNGYCTYISSKKCVRIDDDKVAVTFVLSYNDYPIDRVETDNLPIALTDW